MEYRGDDGVEQALREGRVDVGLTCMPVTTEFESWQLLRDEYIVLFPPQADVPNQITWADLAKFPVILPPNNDTDSCSLLIRGHLTRLGLPLTAAYEIVEDSTIVSMVSRGLGATIIARLAAEPLPPEIQIRDLPDALERPIRVITLSDALHPPAVYAFLDTLRTSVQPELTYTPALA